MNTHDSEGRLIQVLRDWCPTFQGYFPYYPSRRNQAAALTALTDNAAIGGLNNHLPSVSVSE
jgi:hypothetical protein